MVIWIHDNILYEPLNGLFLKGFRLEIKTNLIMSEDMGPEKIQHSQDVREHEQMLLVCKFFRFEMNSTSQLCSYHRKVPTTIM